MTKHKKENERIFLRPYFTHDGKLYDEGEPINVKDLSEHDLEYAIDNGYLSNEEGGLACWLRMDLGLDGWSTAIVREALLHERDRLAELIDDMYPFYGRKSMLISPIWARPKKEQEKYLLWQHKLDSIDEMVKDLNRALGIKEKTND